MCRLGWGVIGSVLELNSTVGCGIPPIDTGPGHPWGGPARFVLSGVNGIWRAPGFYSGLATPIDPLGAGPIPL